MSKQNKSQRIFSKELKALAKKANRRMRDLEAKGYKSPAYQSVQATLEMMGKKKTKGGATGRRFSESGKYTDKNDLRMQLSIINKFLNQQTSTPTGYEKYRDKVYESANKSYDLKAHGITQDDYESLLNALPDDENDRMYYITYYLEVYEAYTQKIERDKANANFKEMEIIEENKYKVEDIIKIMDSSKDYKTALKSLGLTIKDIKKVKKI